MEKRITLFCAFLLIGISLAIAQAVQVTGVVVSAEDDMPVVGASILVKELLMVQLRISTESLY